jgi:hypothetical protein
MKPPTFPRITASNQKNTVINQVYNNEEIFIAELDCFSALFISSILTVLLFIIIHSKCSTLKPDYCRVVEVKNKINK